MLDNIIVEKGIIKNHLGIERDGDFIKPIRFTKKQFAAYSLTEPLAVRSRCMAGICLDMITDSDFVRFDYVVKGIVRNWIYFDVFLNDVFVESIGSDQVDEGEYTFEYRVESKAKEKNQKNRITIYLPYNIDLSMGNFRLAENAFISGIKPYDKTLLCLGDSITQGMDARHPSCIYPVLLSRFLKMELLNQGVGGYVFNSDSLDENFSLKPDIITVAYGTNDWSKCSSPEEFRHNCRDYMEKLVSLFPDIDIYVMTPFWREDLNEMRDAGSFYDLSDTIKDVCRAYPKVVVLDGLELIPHLPAYFGDKWVHPSDEGFKDIALNFLAKTRL